MISEASVSRDAEQITRLQAKVGADPGEGGRVNCHEGVSPEFGDGGFSNACVKCQLFAGDATVCEHAIKAAVETGHGAA